MNPQSRDTVTFLLSVLTSLIVLSAMVVRYVLLPYLRDHLIEPVRETHKQVTENEKSPGSPTLPDRLHDLQTDVGTLTRLLDAHVEWSASEHDRLDEALAELMRQRQLRERNGQ